MTFPGFSIRVLTQPETLREIMPEWRELWHRCRATVFQSPEWLLSWVEVFGPGEIRVIEIRRSAQLVGLAPLLIYPRSSERVLAFMGGGVSDYLDVLVDPLCEPAVIELIWHAIAAEPGWTEFDFTDVPASSTLRTTQFPHESWSQHDVCSALKLPSTEQDLLHIFSNRQRANLRNASSRLRNAAGGRIEVAKQSDLAEALDDLFRLHTKRWSDAGQAGVLNNHMIRQFHTYAAPQLLDCGSLHLHRLRLGGRTLAVIQSFWDHGVVFCYLQGFDPEFSYFSPGTQLMFALLQDAVRAGMQKFDLLRGEESYKLHWRAQPEFTYRLRLSRAALTGVERASAA